MIPLKLLAVADDAKILTDLALAVEHGDFETSVSLARDWSEHSEYESIPAQACTSLFLLAVGRKYEAIEIYNHLRDQLDSFVTPELKSIYVQVMNQALESNEICQSLDYNELNFLIDPLDCKRRFKGWKIKSFLGAIIYTAGLIVTPFNPGVGVSMMTTAAGYLLDGTLGYMDENNRDVEDSNEIPPPDYQSYFVALEHPRVARRSQGECLDHLVSSSAV